MTDEQRELLQPFAERLNQMEQEVSEWPIEEQQKLLDACNAVTNKNCWYATADAARVLTPRLAFNINQSKAEK